MRNKRVVWIVNEYNFPDDHNTRQTILCGLLNKVGYDAYIISGSSENKGEQNRIIGNKAFMYVETEEAKGYLIKTSDYRRSYERVLVAIQFQMRLWKHRKKLPRPDVIVSDFAGLFGNIFLRWKKKYKTKVIYDILDLWPEGFVQMGYLRRNSLITKMLYALEHKAYREADGIIFSMQGGRDYIIDKGWSKSTGGDVDTCNIGYLNNCVDLETVDRQRIENVLDDADLDDDCFKVIYLGSISNMNGLDVLVEAAKELKNRANTNIRILVYGYGNAMGYLSGLVQKYELVNIVLKGKLDKRYAMNLLSRGDLNVFTFRDLPMWKYGVSPNKLFMYFASAKPVLSMIRPNYDLVEEKQAGMSVRNDPITVADAIEQFSKMNIEQYNKYCRNARAVAEEYDYKKQIKVVLDRIEK